MNMILTILGILLFTVSIGMVYNYYDDSDLISVDPCLNNICSIECDNNTKDTINPEKINISTDFYYGTVDIQCYDMLNDDKERIKLGLVFNSSYDKLYVNEINYTYNNETGTINQIFFNTNFDIIFRQELMRYIDMLNDTKIQEYLIEIYTDDYYFYEPNYLQCDIKINQFDFIHPTTCYFNSIFDVGSLYEWQCFVFDSTSPFAMRLDDFGSIYNYHIIYKSATELEKAVIDKNWEILVGY